MAFNWMLAADYRALGVIGHIFFGATYWYLWGRPHKYQNAKQETFWATVEGRLVAMLEGVKDLTLERLNEVTLAWAEQQYHRTRHDEIKTTPLQRFLDAPQVGRDCPDTQCLRQAFRCSVKRKQRRSDGTISLHGKRFEIPNRYRHLQRPTVRYARWDLSAVELIDPRTLSSLGPIYPLDKTANADGRRRTLSASPGSPSTPEDEFPLTGELPPLLRKCLADYAATGRPPAYLPRSDSETKS